MFCWRIFEKNNASEIRRNRVALDDLRSRNKEGEVAKVEK